MKRASLWLAVSSFALLCLGCASTMPGPGGVFPGALAGAHTVPGAISGNALYAAHPDSFTVLGMVEGTSGCTNVLGIFSSGDGGYRAAIADAMSKAGADGLIDCVADIKTSSVLGIYSSSKTIVRGLAIKRK